MHAKKKFRGPKNIRRLADLRRHSTVKINLVEWLHDADEYTREEVLQLTKHKL